MTRGMTARPRGVVQTRRVSRLCRLERVAGCGEKLAGGTGDVGIGSNPDFPPGAARPLPPTAEVPSRTSGAAMCQEQQQSCSISATTHAACFSSGLRCVVSENVVMSFGRHVASEAGLMQCFVARFAVLEVTESPAARRRVLF
jgi:hypothetical protein